MKLDIEQIRVPAERVACAQLARLEPKARDEFRAQNTTSEADRRKVLSSALLLTDTMAPAAYAAAHEAMVTLRVDDRIELYQSTGRGVDTARLAVAGDPIGIELIGNHLSHLDHDGLLALLGHEIGHSIAHCQNEEFAWALELSQKPTTPTRCLYSIAAELTADRFGLIACGDLDAALRLEMQMTAGPAPKGITFDTKAYLAQCRVIAEETLASGSSLVGTSHPEHYIRGYAEALFSETELYQSITGKGSGARGLSEVNAILAKLLRIEVVAAAVKSTVNEKDKPNQQEKQEKGEKKPGAMSESVKRAGGAISRFAGGVIPSIKAALSEKADKPSDASDGGDSHSQLDGDLDPLEEEDRELAARFEELEEQAKPKIRIGD